LARLFTHSDFLGPPLQNFLTQILANIKYASIEEYFEKEKNDLNFPSIGVNPYLQQNRQCISLYLLARILKCLSLDVVGDNNSNVDDRTAQTNDIIYRTLSTLSSWMMGMGVVISKKDDVDSDDDDDDDDIKKVKKDSDDLEQLSYVHLPSWIIKKNPSIDPASIPSPTLPSLFNPTHFFIIPQSIVDLSNTALFPSLPSSFSPFSSSTSSSIRKMMVKNIGLLSLLLLPSYTPSLKKFFFFFFLFCFKK
jgi:hypothetical protein